ncbi:MAG: UbiA-like polyprenyltransferase [Chthoniobacteraceae bacterium]
MSNEPPFVIGRVLTFIRFSHTIFALPFALGAMLVAAHPWPSLQTFGLILLAMVFARTAAMIFNRLADWEIDKRNPRTAGRHRLVTRATALVLLALSSLAFVGVTRWINPICFLLSPLALIIVFFYSLTKRFTAFSHFFLGLALGVSPVGAWLAVAGHFDILPFVLSLAVIFWVAGFDLIYATQDYDFDKREGMHSLVVSLGIARSLILAQWLHATMWLLLILFGALSHLGMAYYAGMILIFPVLIFEHRTAQKMDIAAINRAFFNSNAFVGVVFVAAILLDKIVPYIRA